jgi:hypothetical protein
MSEIEFYRFCLIRSNNDKTEKKNRRNIITFIISLTLIENILVIKKIQEAFKNPYTWCFIM